MKTDHNVRNDELSKVVELYDNTTAKTPQLEEDSESASVKCNDSSEDTSTVARNDKASEDEMNSQKLSKGKSNMPVSRPAVNGKNTKLVEVKNTASQENDKLKYISKKFSTICFRC